MKVGDSVTVPDGRTGILILLQNGVATVLFQIGNHIEKTAFNEADIKPSAT